MTLAAQVCVAGVLQLPEVQSSGTQLSAPALRGLSCWEAGGVQLNTARAGGERLSHVETWRVLDWRPDRHVISMTIKIAVPGDL